MRKHALWVLAVAVILCSLVSLTACKNDPPPAPQIQAIEVSTPPDKTAYYEGEIFDKTGMVVKKVMDNGNKEAVSDYTVDKTGALTLDDLVDSSNPVSNALAKELFQRERDFAVSLRELRQSVGLRPRTNRGESSFPLSNCGAYHRYAPQFGAERGIRTPGSSHFNSFQDYRYRPLSHLC